MKRRVHSAFKLLLPALLLVVALCSPLCASVDSPRSKPAEASPLTPPDRSSPGATLNSFLLYMNTGMRALLEAREIWDDSPLAYAPPPEASARLAVALRHFGRAMLCLDLSEVPDAVRERTAKESVLLLKEILDRTPLPPAEKIPGPAGLLVEGWPPLNRWTVPGTEIQLRRVAEGPDEGRWLVAPESVASLKEEYMRAKSLPYLSGAAIREGVYEEYLVRRPASFLIHRRMSELPEWTTAMLFGHALWQWIDLLLALFVFCGVCAGAWLDVRRYEKGSSALAAGLLKLLLPVLFTVGAAWTTFVIERHLNLSGSTGLLFVMGFTALKWLGWSFILFRLGDLLAELIILGPLQPRRELSPRIDPESIDASLVRTLGRLGGSLAAVVLLADGLSRLGFSFAALLTGFGVAGLALSLAARPSIENVIGGLTLFADRSVKVGETCILGDVRGKVLRIGLRSTRIEAFDHTIISIPNAEFSRMQIVNATRRRDSLMQKNIRLRYETTEDQLRWILASIRELLHAHPMVCADPVPFVRFENYGRSSRDVLVFAYIKAKKRAERMAIEEDILFRIGGIVRKSGSAFARPSATAYIACDAGLDARKGAEAEAEVEKWRESGSYPFPETPTERIAAARGSVEYPPRG